MFPGTNLPHGGGGESYIDEDPGRPRRQAVADRQAEDVPQPDDPGPDYAGVSSNGACLQGEVVLPFRCLGGVGGGTAGGAAGSWEGRGAGSWAERAGNSGDDG